MWADTIHTTDWTDHWTLAGDFALVLFPLWFVQDGEYLQVTDYQHEHQTTPATSSSELPSYLVLVLYVMSNCMTKETITCNCFNTGRLSTFRLWALSAAFGSGSNPWGNDITYANTISYNTKREGAGQHSVDGEFRQVPSLKKYTCGKHRRPARRPRDVNKPDGGTIPPPLISWCICLPWCRPRNSCACKRRALILRLWGII